jgi:hypothetical protein
MSDGRRDARESERIGAAARAAETPAGAALDAALAQIGAAFDDSAAIFDLKMRVERSLCRGPQHPAVRARFAARAAMLSGLSLDAATARVERRWRDERKAFQIASALGYGNRLSLDVLRELRLILRLLRYRRLHAAFGAIVAAVCGDEAMAEAAE